MTASYVRDPTGIVHLVDQSGPNEFTMCAINFADGPGVDDGGKISEDGFTGVSAKGPSNCANCKRHVEELRESMNGARWSTRLLEPEVS